MPSNAANERWHWRTPLEHGVLLQAQQLAKVQEDSAQSEDVDLKRIREVNEHKGLGVLAAHYVQACCCNLHIKNKSITAERASRS